MKVPAKALNRFSSSGWWARVKKMLRTVPSGSVGAFARAACCSSSGALTGGRRKGRLFDSLVISRVSPPRPLTGGSAPVATASAL